MKEGRIDLWADLKLGLKQAGQDKMSQTSCKSSRCPSNFPPNEKSQSLSEAQWADPFQSSRLQKKKKLSGTSYLRSPFNLINITDRTLTKLFITAKIESSYIYYWSYISHALLHRRKQLFVRLMKFLSLQRREPERKRCLLRLTFPITLGTKHLSREGQGNFSFKLR